jgi:mRNA interferase HicA
MKRRDFIQHLNAHGCVLLREGRSHSIFVNHVSGVRAPVPRHRELPEPLLRSICKQLGVPAP